MSMIAFTHYSNVDTTERITDSFTNKLKAMQTKHTLLIAALILLSSWCSTARNADNHPIMRIEKSHLSQSIEVQLANLQQQTTRIALQDLEGTVWFSESVSKQNGYSKKLDLNGMPEGRYLCLVQHPEGRQARAFRLHQGEVQFFEQLEAGNFGTPLLVHTGSARPCIVRMSTDGPKALRVQLTNLQQQDARIRISSVGGGAVFHTKISGEAGYAQNINLEGLEPGTYILDLKMHKTQLIRYIQVTANTIQLEQQQERLELSGDSGSDTAKLE